MLYRFSIVFLIGLCLVACSSGSMQEESVPVIRFKPDEARTLKISELFDGYEVLTFKGIVCNRIGDFVKMGDRIVATSIVTEGMTDVVTLSVFDSAGEFQHTLGRFGRGPECISRGCVGFSLLCFGRNVALAEEIRASFL